jgi:hypothetical protein
MPLLYIAIGFFGDEVCCGEAGISGLCLFRELVRLARTVKRDQRRGSVKTRAIGLKYQPSKRLCQSTGRSSARGATRPPSSDIQAARARHSANVAERLCL